MTALMSVSAGKPVLGSSTSDVPPIGGDVCGMAAVFEEGERGGVSRSVRGGGA
ncbi:hypothetical protein GH5_08107 [Leishmania sp. Ghana 2012 LV757]|uniref:hypothetical protein n=1 Tax=Leishmania sp. Ghana 2012 LV757 TaxID=2803181 RepID=UPI001B3FF645|nr:hypothetical protein GH5_08107 [Leishmania sp. Ghana 2012 LV757]